MGAATTYVALLRGINVGGHAKVGMDHLRRLYIDLGHEAVRTYIQSGNVVFSSGVDEPSRLVAQLEQRIASDLELTVTVLLRTGDDLARVAASNPFLHGGVDLSKLHVTFLAVAPDAERAARLEPPAGDEPAHTRPPKFPPVFWPLKCAPTGPFLGPERGVRMKRRHMATYLLTCSGLTERHHGLA